MGAEYPYRWLSVHWEEGNIITDQLMVGEKLWKSPRAFRVFLLMNLNLI